MKKLLTILCIIALPVFIYAQTDGQPAGAGKPNPDATNSVRAGDLNCPEGTVYSHSNLDVGLRASGTFYNVNGFHSYDRYEGSVDLFVGQVVVWGSDLGPNYLNRTFIFQVYQEVGGKPINLLSTTGTTTLVETTPFFSIGYPLCKYTLTLDSPVMIHPGEWICPYATDGLSFYWNYGTGGDNFQWGYNGDNLQWYSADYDYAFCLVSGQEVPVSDWALAMGVLLILAFTLIRFVRTT